MMGKNGKYNFAVYSPNKLSLVQGKREVDARKTTQYGLEFEYSAIMKPEIKITHYKDTEEEEITKFGKNYAEDYEALGRINLNVAIEGLEELVDENGADYVLVDKNPRSLDCKGHWDFKTKGRFILKTQK